MWPLYHNEPLRGAAADFAPYASASAAAAAAITEGNLRVKTALYAAEELRDYLRRLTGAAPPDRAFPIVSAAEPVWPLRVGVIWLFQRWPLTA